MKSYLLLVEDDENTAYLMIKALEKNSFPGSILRVDDGEEALQHLFSTPQKPTLILLDMRLPKVSGLEVLEMIRNTTELMSIPVILQTASSIFLQEDQDRAHALGVNRYMMKPMGFDELVTQMSEITDMFSTAVCFGDESYCN